MPTLNHYPAHPPTFYKNSKSKASLYTPRQMPRVVAPAKLAPKLQSSPLVWSHGSVRLQSSFSCLAQTLQQPQPSRTTLTPGAQWGISSGHSHMAGQEAEERTCTANNTIYERVKSTNVASAAPKRNLSALHTIKINTTVLWQT